MAVLRLFAAAREAAGTGRTEVPGTTAEGRKAFAFEASSKGDVVVKNGWAEVEA